MPATTDDSKYDALVNDPEYLIRRIAAMVEFDDREQIGMLREALRACHHEMNFRQRENAARTVLEEGS